MPGSGADILNDAGEPTAGELGELVMTLPAIGNTRSLWRDDDRAWKLLVCSATNGVRAIGRA